MCVCVSYGQKRRKWPLHHHPGEDTIVTTLTEASKGPQRGGVGEQSLDPPTRAVDIHAEG